MISEYQSFVDGDAGRCGAILRNLAPGRLHTRTVFKMGKDAPIYLVDHLVEHEGDVHRWTRFRWSSPTSGNHHEGTREAEGAVHIDGTAVPALAGALPGFAEHLVLAQLLAGEVGSMSYLQFNEGAPEDGAVTAELHRRGTETTELADGTMVEAERVQLEVNGESTNTHWCVEGVVVKSDWCGAQSFLVDDLESLIHGLDDEVVARIREFATQSTSAAGG